MSLWHWSSELLLSSESHSVGKEEAIDMAKFGASYTQVSTKGLSPGALKYNYHMHFRWLAWNVLFTYYQILDFFHEYIVLLCIFTIKSIYIILSYFTEF